MRQLVSWNLVLGVPHHATNKTASIIKLLIYLSAHFTRVYTWRLTSGSGAYIPWCCHLWNASAISISGNIIWWALNTNKASPSKLFITFSIRIAPRNNRDIERRWSLHDYDERAWRAISMRRRLNELWNETLYLSTHSLHTASIFWQHRPCRLRA